MLSPLTADEFAVALDRLGPFEKKPALAVAVSGGADSLALCRLAADWTAARGGALLALTVDHGLRPQSGAEAERLSAWLARAGIRHEILTWSGEKPVADLQAEARRARYRLLIERCREEGILHLLLGHHREDQAETFLLRLGRGSGVDGLAAMAPVTETAALRLLRPLLDIPKGRLEACLAGLGQDWIEDPSNGNPAFGRVRLRRLRADLAGEGLTPERLAATAARLRLARAALTAAAAELAAEAVRLDEAGYGLLDAARLKAAPAEIGLRLVSGLVRIIGAGTYPPRLDRIERLHDALCRGLAARRSIGGCLVSPWKGAVLLAREPAALASPIAVTAGETVRWDDRFEVTPAGRGEGWLGALGAEGLRQIKDLGLKTRHPRPVLACLPALADLHGVCAVPHLGYVRGEPGGLTVAKVRFVPPAPLF